MWWNDGNESMDDWILNQWPRNDGKGFGKNKQSKHWIFNDHWVVWNRKENADPMMELLFDWTRSARMEGTSMNKIKSIKQYSKLISIELSRMKKVTWHIEDLEYLNTINIQDSEILSNVTERGCWKLSFSELSMDVRLGRSTFDHFESFH